MNTAIRKDAQGLGFAIPVETLQRIATQLFETGEVQHPYLGIQMVQLSPEMKTNLNQDPDLDITVTEDEGVIILRVLAGTPAESGGLRKGDIIESVNGVAVETPTDVQAQVDASQIGEPLAVTVRRKDKTETIEVNPMAMPPELQ